MKMKQNCVEYELLESKSKAAEVGFSCKYNSRIF